MRLNISPDPFGRVCGKGIRVLHVISATVFGGAERMLQKLLMTWNGNVFDSRIVSLTPKGPIGQELEDAGVSIRHLNASGYLDTAAKLPRLIQHMRAFRPDVIQGWMYHGNLAASAAALIAGHGAPVVWNIRHSLEDMQNEKRLTALTIRSGAWLSKVPRLVIYNSSASMKQHQAMGYSRNNGMVIPNGFDTSRFRPSLELRAEVRESLHLEEHHLLVGLIARYHPVKAHADFLEAAAMAARRLPEVRLLLIGEGVDCSNRELAGKVLDGGLREKVLLLGERSDVDKLLPALDLLALSSLSEGFPNVLGEAMACAVPCVSTDVGDCSWVVGETGRVVPPGRLDLFGRAMIELLEEPRPERIDRGIRARERIEKLFSLESVAHRYEELYRSVCAGGDR